MRRRFVTTIIAALVGIVVSPYINKGFDLAPAAALALGGLAGLLLGYVASMLFDVFTSDFNSTTDVHLRD
jgi:hypothetical protein